MPVMKPVLFTLAVAACGKPAQDPPRVETKPAQAESPTPVSPPQPDTGVGLPEVAGPRVQPAPTTGQRITIANPDIQLGIGPQ